MRPSWQPCVVVAALREVPGGPAVDLKIESHIPSKVRRPHDDQMPTGLSGGGSERNRADESKHQVEPASGVVF